MSDADQYNYRLVWSEPDREWVGLCDAFPGLSWLEKDQQAALRGIRKMVHRALEIFDEDEMPQPAPTRTGAAATPADVSALLGPTPPRPGAGALRDGPDAQQVGGALNVDPLGQPVAGNQLHAAGHRAEPICGVTVKSTGKPCILKQRHSGRHRSVLRARPGKRRRRYR